MGKKSRKKRDRKLIQAVPPELFWQDSDGIHTSFLIPGEPPPGAEEEMTADFQKRIRNSPLWKQMVEEFGEEKAEELLKQCKAKIK